MNAKLQFLIGAMVLLGLSGFAWAADEPAWSIEGRAISGDSCGVACPCNIGGAPHHGKCEFVMIFHIDKGSYGDVKLDGAEFAMAGEFTRKAFGEPTHHTFVAYYIDSEASDEQREALDKLVNGPSFAAMGEPAEVKEKPIQVKNLENFGKVDEACVGTVGEIVKLQVTPVPGGTDKTKPLVIENQAEPGFIWTAQGVTKESFYKSAGKDLKMDGTSGESIKFKMAGGES